SSRTRSRCNLASVFACEYGPPVQSVSSLSCRRSRGTPPKTIAPSRPLPIGSASVHSRAAASYQSFRSVISGDRPKPLAVRQEGQHPFGPITHRDRLAGLHAQMVARLDDNLFAGGQNAI